MSVGVDSIDNDHKLLLQTINEINDAITEGQASELIGEIVGRLEQYIVEHFAREEVLMHQCKYDDFVRHRRQHQKFINKIPELKDKLLSADSSEVALEMSLFLTHWLMNHIIQDDMSYAQAAYEHRLTVESATASPPFFDRLFGWVSQRIVLSRRIFLSTMVPFTALLVLVGFNLWDYYQQYHRVQQLLGITQLARNINQYTHHLQIERGLSTGYISSAYQGFAEELSTQRRKSDQAGRLYQAAVKALPEIYHKGELAQVIEAGQWWVSRLDELRTKVDQQLRTAEEMQQHYTGTIRTLLSIYDIMPLLSQAVRLDGHIDAISALVNMKEANGLERAQGTAILEGSIDQRIHRAFVSLIGEQSGYLRLYANSASPQQMARWSDFTQSKVYQSAMAAERELLDKLANGTTPVVTPEQWFELMTNKIDQTEYLVGLMMQEIEGFSNGLVQEKRRALILYALLMLLLLLLTLSISWVFNHSIINPIRRLSDAMGKLSEGERGIRFTDQFAKDEIGMLYGAYEENRRSAIKDDIATTVRFQRQEYDFELNEREREHLRVLASVDPLTGVLNRRRFYQVAEAELHRVRRYQQDLSCLMLDLDHFKQINDRYGHAAGDQILRSFCEVCERSVRRPDTIARIGGEEFIILLPETYIDDAFRLAERIRRLVEEMRVALESGETAQLTVSIGVGCWTQEIEDINQLMERVDTALYQAKHQGRNRVVLADCPQPDE